MIRYILFFIFAFTLQAHQTGLSYIDIKEDENKNISVVYKKPLGDIKAKDLGVNYPSKCTQKAKKTTTIENGFIVYKYDLWCTKDGLMDSRIWIEGLKPLNRGVLFYYKNPLVEKKSLLKANNPYFYIDKVSSDSGLFTEYVELGIAHILSGYDHLLFVLSLILLASSRKILLMAVSAFTVSHSVTLISTIFGLISIPVLFVEAMIALSIVFLARELLVIKLDSLTRRHLELIAFGFGLLHGLGFSNVLKSIGLPQDDTLLALVAFNIGIELGQLFFIFCASICLFLLRKYFVVWREKSIPILSYIIGGFSAYWFIQRVILF